MEFVSVGLHSADDSTFTPTRSTDKNGSYVFGNIPSGNYYLEISLLGFETVKSDIFQLNRNMNMGTIEIHVSAKTLGDVDIVEDKNTLVTSIDKKIYNVDKDLMSKSGSANDILQNIPSVTVDQDGVVSLRGSANVTILINGKPSPQMRNNSAGTLLGIPASNIERIEIITNPSAKYKPDGTAGIINIVLKKDTDKGLNGTVIANGGNQMRYNASLLMNYNFGKLNLFGNYAFRQDAREYTLSDTRTINDLNSTTFFDQTSTSKYRPVSHTARIGFDYSFNKMNKAGISGNYFYTDFIRDEMTSTTLWDEQNNLLNDYNRNRMDKEREYDKELSTYFYHKFKKEDHELNFEANFTDHFEEENNHFTNQWRIPSLPTTFDNTLIRQYETAGDATIEYVYPISEDAEFEAGYEGEYIHQDFNFLSEYLNDGQHQWIKDTTKSNEFIFTQILHAVYVTYSNAIDDFGFMIGLRSEQALVTSELVTLDSLVQNNYFSLYPTLHLSYEVSDEKEWQLNYSNRVNRPEGDELNPFPEYDDPRYIEAGNPKIKPERIHSAELGFQLKNDKIVFVPSLYYHYTYDAFTEISYYINDSTLLTSYGNLDKEQSAGLELILSGKWKKKISYNLSGNVFYNQIDASNLGFSENKSAFSCISKLAMNFTLTTSTFMQVNANFWSPRLTPQGRDLALFYINTGFRQEVFKKKGSITLTVSDLFNTMKWSSEIDTPELRQKFSGKRKSQIVYLGFTYHFGKVFKKGNDDLKFDEKM